jgi:hypothetical protein
MKTLQDPFRSGASGLVAAEGGLGTGDNFETTYLQPLRVFNSVIDRISDVCVAAFLEGTNSCSSN